MPSKEALLPGDARTVQIFNRLDQINFVEIGVIVVVAWVLMKTVERVFPWLAQRVPSRLRMYLLPSIAVVRLIILLVAVALIIPLVIRTSVQNIIAILGVAAVALGFAFKDYISSLIAGIVAIYERPYRVGDWITVDGSYGEVQSMNLRALRLFTPGDTVVTVPHIKIWTSNILNSNDGNRNLLCVVHFYLDPEHNAVQVSRKLHDVALTSSYLDMHHDIRVVVEEEPWSTHYQLKAYPRDSRDQFQFITDLTVRGKSALAALRVKPARRWPPPVGQDYGREGQN
jgi:small conductance mechanosensitive channel